LAVSAAAWIFALNQLAAATLNLIQ